MVAYEPPQWYFNTISTSSSYPQYVATVPQYRSFVSDVSFDPNPKPPPKPETDLDWVRRQVDSVCALAKP